MRAGDLGFLGQNFRDVRRVIANNVSGTIYLLHKLACRMVGRGEGRILFAGSIAGFMPGTFQAL